ncbi:MAG: glycosyltransferase [Betaproteobacteria bacterium]|nr:MAG: glycosyltransferase [Betaproteobacteria bacterium]
MNRHLDFIVAGDPGQLTGGYVYDACIVGELRSRGWTVRVHGLPGSFPDADDDARTALQRTLAELPAGSRVVVDGLALGGLPEIALAHARRLRLVALVHHPLGDEGGLTPVRRRCLLASERAALAAACRVIATSAFTARRLADFGVHAARLRVVEPGVRRMPPAAADRHRPRLLCVATLTPRKAQDLLVLALARLRHLPWHCDCIGSLSRAPAFTDEVARLVATAGLSDRIRLLGERDAKGLRQAYAESDLFVLPSRYEGYGMVITEAIAAGLPILTTTGGALADTLPAGAGIGVPPGDVDALAEALGRLLQDGELRLRLRDGARRERDRLREWSQAGAEFAAALADLPDAPPDAGG